jgi:hypothetical protein
MKNEEITIILPCAGEGSRLGLKSPKELYEIMPGTRLIDFSLGHILAVPARLKEKISAAVVIRPWKQAVADYVREQLPGITVNTVMFDDNYSEWPGSVYSANQVFAPKNLVLLPDSFLSLAPGSHDLVTEDENGKTLVELVSDALDIHKTVFGVIACQDAGLLGSMGALKVENGKVTAFQDKPAAALEQYNGFWGCYGFRKKYGKLLYDFLTGSVRHSAPRLSAQPFYPPGAIPLGAYHDLGTWPGIKSYLCLRRPGPFLEKGPWTPKNFCLR